MKNLSNASVLTVDIAKFSVLASCPYIMQYIYIITKQIDTCEFTIYTLLASNN